MYFIAKHHAFCGGPRLGSPPTGERRRAEPPRASARQAIGAVAARSADWDSTGARRGLQVALGLTWLLDAALQCQPFMFGNGFVTQVLASAQAGNPGAVAAPALAAGHLIAHNAAAWNAVFATVQLALAVGLLWRPTVKAALAGTVAWSVTVWWLGEGLGGVLTGSATPVTGAPGAVVLYAFLAVLLWPPRTAVRDNGAIAYGSPLGVLWSRAGWLVLWASAAYLTLQPPNRAPGSLSSTFARLADGEPGWVAAMDRSLAATLGPHGTAAVVVVAVAAVLAACAVLIPVTARPALALSALLAAAIWVTGENFGGILTGRATDPDTGPLLIMLALAFWPRRRCGSHHAIVRHDVARRGSAHCSLAYGVPLRQAGTSK